jgi:flagellar biogenesis protein FliO
MSSSDTTLPTSSPSPSTSTLAAVDGVGSQAWIAGAVLGSIAVLGLFAATFWLWMRHRNHSSRQLGTQREAQIQIAHTQTVGPQREICGEHGAPPFMLHADSGRITPELAG